MSIRVLKNKNRMAFWRKVRGVSQEKLARAVGVSAHTISNCEQGYTTPAPEHAKAVAAFLRVNIREIFPFEVLE